VTILKCCVECGALSEQSRCPRHRRRPWEGSTRSRELPPDWSRRRAGVLDRDPICTICREAISTEVDHIEPGNNHSYENLQGVCTRCHMRKTQQEAADARAGR
jgi:5-methylcytosine-specific restriction protein A